MILQRNEPPVEITLNSIAGVYVDYPSRVGNGESFIQQALTPAQGYELYSQCILPDMGEGVLGRHWYYTKYEEYEGTLTGVSIHYTLNNPNSQNENDEIFFYHINVEVDSHRTNSWLEEHLP
jgi:hypothetical protein